MDSTSNSKIAVLLHLFYTDMWGDICTYLQNLNHHQYDLYVNLVDGYYNPEIVSEIKKFKPAVIVINSPNKGVDIGGFLFLYQKLEKEYDLILKLHTKKSLGLPEKQSDYVSVYGYENAKKKGNEWFHRLMQGVLSNKNNVDTTIELLTIGKPFVMAGLDCETYVGNNITLINSLAEIFSIPVEYIGDRFKEANFVGGTIFWAKNDILKKYLTPQKIEFLLKMLPDGYHNEPSYNHASERLFGLMVNNEKKKILVL